MSKLARPGPNQDRRPPIPHSQGLRRNSSRRFRAWAWLLGMATLGCSSAPTTVRLEVYNWWDGAESIPFERVLTIHRSLHPNVEVVNQSKLVAGDARERVADIMLAGAPPATFQANIGADLLRWTAVDSATGALGENRIYNLSSLFARSKDLQSVIPQEIMDALSVGTPPVPYAVPINIHRLNVLYYNTAKLAALSPPSGHQSWLEPSLLCPTDPTPTPLPFKIAIGSREEPFTITLLVFENLLVAQAGAEFYERLFRGEMSTVSGVADDWKEVVRTTLRCAQFLGQFIEETDGWKDAVKAVVDETDAAAVTVMGDWAGGQLASEPNYDGTTILSMPFPGTEADGTRKGVYVYTSDAFPLPVNAEHLSEAETLLETIALPEAQKIFSKEKGSIPARSDAVDEVDAKRLQDFRDSAKALATSGLFPPYYDSEQLNEKLLAVLKTEWGSKDGPAKIEAVVEELVSLQPVLLRWQDRLRRGPLDSPMP